MPLSEATERSLVHTRTIECWGYQRADGLWDIEARLRDRKTYPFENEWRGDVPPGEPVHDMWVRLTLDEELLIHGVEASSDRTPFQACGEVVPNFSVLVGERIGSGWSRLVRQKVGGLRGCTHLSELLGRIATVAYQTIFPKTGRFPTVGPDRRPALLNSCHGWSDSGQAVKQRFPRWYTGP